MTRYGAGVRSWNLLEIEAPDGVRTPTVLHSGDGRAIALRLEPGQMLGDHQVRERAWLTVVEGEVVTDPARERLVDLVRIQPAHVVGLEDCVERQA